MLRCLRYGIVTYIWLKCIIHVGKYSSPMGNLGMLSTNTRWLQANAFCWWDPLWGYQTMPRYVNFWGFVLQNALFGWVIWLPIDDLCLCCARWNRSLTQNDWCNRRTTCSMRLEIMSEHVLHVSFICCRHCVLFSAFSLNKNTVQRNRTWLWDWIFFKTHLFIILADHALLDRESHCRNAVISSAIHCYCLLGITPNIHYFTALFSVFRPGSAADMMKHAAHVAESNSSTFAAMNIWATKKLWLLEIYT